MMVINPFLEGYYLVLLKSHCVNLLDADLTDLAAVLPTAQKVARAV